MPVLRLAQPADSHWDRFIAVYPKIRKQLTSMRRPGFLLVAEGPDGRLSSNRLALLEGRSSHRIIGRHSRSNVHLSFDPMLSLRHLLVSVWLDEDEGAVLRVLDLGGMLPMVLEDGEPCASFQANGSCFASLGTGRLFFLLADGRPWPEDPQEAWEQLGDRSIGLRQENSRHGEFSHRFRPRLQILGSEGSSTNSTVVVRLRGPGSLLDLPGDCPDAVGYLVLPNEQFVRLSPEDLHRGVLVGRYDRCELGGNRFSEDTTVSRIHLCLALDPTGLWAIDTCSTNGSYVHGRRLRAVRLGRRQRIFLGTQPLCWQMN